MNDDDLATAAAPRLEVKGAAACFALAGLFTTLTGVQILGVEWVAAWMNAARYVFLGLGVALFVIGLRIYRGDARANVFGLVVAPLASLFAMVWFVVTFGAILSLMNVVAVGMTGLAALLGLLALRHTRRMADAKARLADEGMSLGL